MYIYIVVRVDGIAMCFFLDLTAEKGKPPGYFTV